MSEQFTPWRKPLTVGGALIGIGVAGAYLSLQILEQLPIWPFGVCVAVGMMVFKRGYVRLHGAVVEVRAVDALKRRLPGKWALQADVPTPHGNCDVLVTDEDGYGYAVEIKSKSAVMLEKRIFRSNRLRYAKGDPEPHIRQAIANAGFLRAKPVLWYPSTPNERQGTIILTCGDRQVIVVAGDEKKLIKAIDQYH